ncbi:MAG: hypothetical protein IPK15_04900 [Verrucomicrobia bacterium]|nr:hypothetical protein [Verrucomicrobiota bacterium]
MESIGTNGAKIGRGFFDQGEPIRFSLSFCGIEVWQALGSYFGDGIRNGRRFVGLSAASADLDDVTVLQTLDFQPRSENGVGCINSQRASLYFFPNASPNRGWNDLDERFV